MPNLRFKLPNTTIVQEEVIALSQQRAQDHSGDFDARMDVRLPGMGLRFDWGKLQEIDDECRLLILNDRQIAWLNDIVGRLTREQYYKNPEYLAELWGIDTSHADWGDIQQFAEDTEACLIMGCKVSDLNDTLKEMLGVQKYLLAAFTDGIVRDHYYDPGHAADFAQKVGVSVDDLPTWDLNPTDGDIFYPNMASFDEIGTNTVTDPDTGQTITTSSRRMVEEVPSVFIYDGWISDSTLADMYAETQYYNLLPQAELPDGTIPSTQIFVEVLERMELAMRHIDAKLSRSGRLDLHLPDVPHIRHPVAGQKTELSLLLGQYGIPLVGPTGAPWPLVAWTKPSVFTAGSPRSDDPLGVFEEAFNYDSHAAEALAKGLIADWRPTIRLTQGLAPVLTFPAVNIPLPGNIGTVTLPPMPLYAGVYDAYVPGESGRGLADLLKQEEEVKVFDFDLPGVGTVEAKWDRHRFFVKIPSLPSLPGGGIVPGWISNYFGQSYLGGLLPGEWTQIFPYVRTTYQRAIYEKTKIKNPGLGQLFKDILQIQVDNPTYDPQDPNSKETIDGLTFAELFWIKPDDPNYRENIQSHAQILNFLQIQWSNQLAELIQAIDDCCANNQDELIKPTLEKIAQTMECLEATNNALVQIHGGTTPDCAPDTTVPMDCQAIAALYDELVNILDWLVWGVETVGGFVAAPIVSALTGFRWFTSLLLAAGLVEPTPAEEVVTIPLWLGAMLTYVVEKVIALGVTVAREMVSAMQSNRTSIINLLCGSTDLDIEINIDDVIQIVKDAFTDAGVKTLIQDLLENYLKSEQVKGVILSK